jgi:hypothetical protein
MWKMRENLDQKTPINQTPKREQTTQTFEKKRKEKVYHSMNSNQL